MELKLCPFCGGKASVCEAEVDGETLFMAACESCGISTAGSDNEAVVVSAWNKRVSE
jgi:Lar family restriction alleviation protein